MFASQCDICATVTQTRPADWRKGLPPARCGRCGAALGKRGKVIKTAKKPTRKRYTTRSLRVDAKPILERQSELQELARQRGLSIRVKQIQGYRKLGLHVMVSQDGYRVADYWPSTGTLLIGSERTTAEGVEAALMMIGGRVNKTYTPGLTPRPNQSNAVSANRALVGTADT